MNYGLYLSATGVLTSSHRQDVIANNLANVETVGFKKDLALFQDRLTAAQERRLSARSHSHPMLEAMGGGHLHAPTQVDQSQGQHENTGNPLDLAIQGDGFFGVRRNGQTLLTRDGRFLMDREGYLVRAADGEAVLNPQQQPILFLNRSAKLTFNDDGSISQNGQVVERVGLFAVQDKRQLVKKGDTLMSHPNAAGLGQAEARVRSGALERSNVEPAEELRAMMEAQRLLEANANMIRFQDQTLAKLVNEVGKIG